MSMEVVTKWVEGSHGGCITENRSWYFYVLDAFLSTLFKARLNTFNTKFYAQHTIIYLTAIRKLIHKDF